MVNSNDEIKTEASTNYDMDTWGTLNAFDQCPINFTLQNRFYFVFIAEFVKLLPIIFRSIYEVPTCLKLSTAPVPIFPARGGEALSSLQYLAQEHDAMLQR